ncbi:MAG: glycoside hydrolase family 13 protein [Spirochaetales bacterium]|nr:glycoside hydrolase family 13 protein [Spirochaetales bacterium]
MNYSAIDHKAFDNYCYCLNENEVRVSLKTGKDIDKVEIVWGDPFDGGVMGEHGVWGGSVSEIRDCMELESNLLWSIVVAPKFKRLRYYFIIYSGNEKIVFAESGFSSVEDASSGKYSEFFIFPWMNGADIIQPPEWVKSCVWYQIFPSRFSKGEYAECKKAFLPWSKLGQPVSNHECYGGNLQGIIDRLDYLKDLGITGIYSTPVNQSSSQHKYDTEDYLSIDSDFGTNETFARLVKEAHERGIRIMVDGVFNHCGKEFFAWQDVLKNKEHSKYRDWFFVKDFDIRDGEPNASKGKFYSFAFVDNMPKLNTNNPEVQDYFIDVCKKWIKDFDVDGLRLDVANEVSHEFWKRLYAETKKVKKDFYIVGEIWHNSIPWLREKEFDAVMNYPIQKAISTFLGYEESTALDLEHNLNRCLSMYYSQTNEVLLNQMDSHDTIRITNRLKSTDKALCALAILFALPGSVCIYYGTEVLLEGGHDPDNRRCMPWSEIESGMFDDRIKFTKKLISLRKNCAALRSSDIKFIREEKSPRVLHFVKKQGGQTPQAIHVYVNCSKKSFSLGNLSGNKILLSHNLNGNELLDNGFALVLSPEQ